MAKIPWNICESIRFWFYLFLMSGMFIGMAVVRTDMQINWLFGTISAVFTVFFCTDLWFSPWFVMPRPEPTVDPSDSDDNGPQRTKTN